MIWSWYIEAAWVIPREKILTFGKKWHKRKGKKKFFTDKKRFWSARKTLNHEKKFWHSRKIIRSIRKKKIYTREKGSDPRDKIFDLREKELIKECTNLWKHATHETHKGTRHTRFSRFSYWMRWSKTIWICSVWATTNLFHGKQYKLSKMDGSHSLEITYLNPEIFSILWNRGFSVNLSGNLFSEIAVNMTLE